MTQTRLCGAARLNLIAGNQPGVGAESGPRLPDQYQLAGVVNGDVNPLDFED